MSLGRVDILENGLFNLCSSQEGHWPGDLALVDLSPVWGWKCPSDYSCGAFAGCHWDGIFGQHLPLPHVVVGRQRRQQELNILSSSMGCS